MRRVDPDDDSLRLQQKLLMNDWIRRVGAEAFPSDRLTSESSNVPPAGLNRTSNSSTSFSADRRCSLWEDFCLICIQSRGKRTNTDSYSVSHWFHDSLEETVSPYSRLLSVSFLLRQSFCTTASILTFKISELCLLLFIEKKSVYKLLLFKVSYWNKYNFGTRTQISRLHEYWKHFIFQMFFFEKEVECKFSERFVETTSVIITVKLELH